MRVGAVSFILKPRTLQVQQPVTALRTKKPVEFQPIRRGLGFKGQAHRPGHHFFRTLNALVPYESRLERSCLLHWDYQGQVRQVTHQPLFVHIEGGRSSAGHVPDYLLLLDSGEQVLVDVKPRRFLEREQVQLNTQLMLDLCLQLGWMYSLESEPDPIYLANLNLLHAFGRRPLGYQEFVEPLILACAENDRPIGEVVGSLLGPPALVKPVLLHLLWHRILRADLNQLLEDNSLVSLLDPGLAAGLLETL